MSLASGLQELRNAEDRAYRLDIGFPVFRQLSAKNLDLYSEDLLRACLLRLVRPAEWQGEWRRSAESVIEGLQEHDGFLDLELLLAIARRSLMPPAEETLVGLGARHGLDARDVKRLVNVV
jgi:hypothetical protein